MKRTIISASRRTDIPAFYSEWLYHRIKERFVMVRNPRNFRQVSKISLVPDDVDGIVFWTKNPIPMLDRLDELKDFIYYFQFTITPYGKDIEPGLPAKDPSLLTKEPGLPANEQNLPSEGSGLLAKEQNLPSEGSGLPANEQNLPSEGSGLPANEQNLPSEGSGRLVKEPYLPAKESIPFVTKPNHLSEAGDILTAFKKLSDMIGPDRIIWRYDPILINAKYSTEYHIHAFGMIAEALHGFTRKVTISFIDENYRGVRSNIKGLALHDFPFDMQIQLSSELAKIAHSYGLAIDTCAEKLDLSRYGIGHARCIDDRLFETLLGRRLDIGKDKNQRPECGCASSIDIGMYNTCQNGCLYCYANYNPKMISKNITNHNPQSPLLYDEPSLQN